MTTWGPDWFGVSDELYRLSLTVMMISVSFTPMALAPLSEVVSLSTSHSEVGGKLMEVVWTEFDLPNHFSRLGHNSVKYGTSSS